MESNSPSSSRLGANWTGRLSLVAWLRVSAFSGWMGASLRRMNKHERRSLRRKIAFVINRSVDWKCPSLRVREVKSAILDLLSTLEVATLQETFDWLVRANQSSETSLLNLSRAVRTLSLEQYSVALDLERAEIKYDLADLKDVTANHARWWVDATRYFDLADHSASFTRSILLVLLKANAGLEDFRANVFALRQLVDRLSNVSYSRWQLIRDVVDVPGLSIEFQANVESLADLIICLESNRYHGGRITAVLASQVRGARFAAALRMTRRIAEQKIDPKPIVELVLPRIASLNGSTDDFAGVFDLLAANAILTGKIFDGCWQMAKCVEQVVERIATAADLRLRLEFLGSCLKRVIDCRIECSGLVGIVFDVSTHATTVSDFCDMLTIIVGFVAGFDKRIAHFSCIKDSALPRVVAASIGPTDLRARLQMLDRFLNALPYQSDLRRRNWMEFPAGGSPVEFEQNLKKWEELALVPETPEAARERLYANRGRPSPGSGDLDGYYEGPPAYSTE